MSYINPNSKRNPHNWKPNLFSEEDALKSRRKPNKNTPENFKQIFPPPHHLIQTTTFFSLLQRWFRGIKKWLPPHLAKRHKITQSSLSEKRHCFFAYSAAINLGGQFHRGREMNKKEKKINIPASFLFPCIILKYEK